MKKEEFKKIVENKSDILLLDIREVSELSGDDSIEGAKHMPMGKVFTEAGSDNLPKNKKIIVFCRTGGRAEIVVTELRKRGYKVDGLEGGLNDLYSK